MIVRYIVVHQTKLMFGTTDGIRRYHTKPKPDGNGWRDIGYHAVCLNGFEKIDSEYDPHTDGVIEIGRQWDQEGAHCPRRNKDSLAIALVGNYRFTQRQLDNSALWCANHCLNLGLDYSRVRGHDEEGGGPGCPGFDMDVFRARVRQLMVRPGL